MKRRQLAKRRHCAAAFTAGREEKARASRVPTAAPSSSGGWRRIVALEMAMDFIQSEWGWISLSFCSVWASPLTQLNQNFKIIVDGCWMDKILCSCLLTPLDLNRNYFMSFFWFAHGLHHLYPVIPFRGICGMLRIPVVPMKIMCHKIATGTPGWKISTARWVLKDLVLPQHLLLGWGLPQTLDVQW